MSAELVCPHCRVRIPPDDVNLQTDVALCRACGKTSNCSAIGGDDGISLAALGSPPASIERGTDEFGNERIVYRRQIPGGQFILPAILVGEVAFLIPVCSILLRGGFNILWLFILPFLAGAVVSAGVATFIFRGRWEVTLGRGSGNVFAGVAGWGWRRRFEFGRSTAISLESTKAKVNGVAQSGICIQNGGQKIVFGTMIPAEAKAFIAAALLDAQRRM